MNRLGAWCLRGGVALFLLAAAGCGSPNLFVLLPNADGTVGKVIVANDKGRQVLTRPGEATEVPGAGAAPGMPKILPSEDVEARFGPALRAQPDPAETFVLYFEDGTTTLTPDSEQRLGEIVGAIADRRSVDTSVVGHSDTRGDAAVNRILSKRRAIEVARILLERGVNPAILDITSHGASNPLPSTPDETNASRNSRVSVTVR